MSDIDSEFIAQALELAEEAGRLGEVPVGAVAVKDGQIIGRGFNRREIDRDPFSHAEMSAMRQAAQAVGARRLVGVALYVTLEPCAMCAGAIHWSGIRRVVFALSEESLYAMANDSTTPDESLYLPCREVFARSGRPVEVIGPLIEDEARVVHEGFW